MKVDIYDVAVIGGGPAGSTAAALLARAGRRVIIFEREKFPRFHIGESLLPFSMQTFDRLGLREKLDRTFLPKFGGEIAAACGSKGGGCSWVTPPDLSIQFSAGAFFWRSCPPKKPPIH
jgi:flavin-dependent dehydrogenase